LYCCAGIAFSKWRKQWVQKPSIGAVLLWEGGCGEKQRRVGEFYQLDA
jgi:hypothetical protein